MAVFEDRCSNSKRYAFVKTEKHVSSGKLQSKGEATRVYKK